MSKRGKQVAPTKAERDENMRQIKEAAANGCPHSRSALAFIEFTTQWKKEFKQIVDELKASSPGQGG